MNIEEELIRFGQLQATGNVSYTVSDVEKLLALSKKHKVLEIVVKNLEGNNNIDEDTEKAIRKVMKSAYKTVTEDFLDEISSKLPKDWVYLKGAAISKKYPEGYERFQGDIDIMVPDVQALKGAIEGLYEYDYDFDRLKLYIFEEEPLRFAGSFDMKDSKRRYDEFSSLDFHVAPFYIWGAVVYPELAESSCNIDGNRIVPNDTNLVCMLVAHIANHWVYRMRDINDLYVLKRSGKVDWNQVQIILKKLHLTSVWNVLECRYQQIYGESLIRKVTENELTRAEKLFMDQNFGNVSRLGSFLIELRFAFQNYRTNNSAGKAFIMSMKNTYCMLRFKNRAFVVNKRTMVKPWKKNQIIVLYQDDVFLHKNSCKEMTIINQGTTDERVITSFGIWRQGSYHGK